jgi:UDP-N-acetylmuramate--alanine ligase
VEPNRIFCVFQPHLYSRTKFFCDDFARVLGGVHKSIVTDLYPAREEPIPGVDSGLIVDSAQRQGFNNVMLLRDMQAVPAMLAPELEPGDVVLVLGAGSINKIAGSVLKELEAR